MDWKGTTVSDASHVVQMVEDAHHAACTFGDSLLLLDRCRIFGFLKQFFHTWHSAAFPGLFYTIAYEDVPALEKLRSLNNSGDVRMEIITKAKKSCTAFEKPPSRKPGRGRPPKKGAAVHLLMLKGIHAQLRMFPARMPSPPNICP